MIEKLWFQRSLIAWLCFPVLYPLSRLYKWISVKRKNDFLSGKKVSYRSPVPVVIVGNITAGGNGKTPVVIWLAETLKAKGYKPGIISRGYGGKSEHYPLRVSDGVQPAECGDEPKLIAVRTGLPVIVAPKRTDAARELLQYDVDIIISDDGLQHYALTRDIELIVVDGKRRFGNGHFIPLGPMRESLERLDSVDFIINNGAEKSREMSMTLCPERAVNLVTGETEDVASLSSVIAFAGIGHPPRFFMTLKGLNTDIVETVSFSDHQVFTEADLAPFLAHDGDVVMTEKDAVKCRQFAKDNWWYLPVSAKFSTTDEAKIIHKIEEVIKQYGP
ncbi:tetraacyldisaccharide 4'-kinase [Vibrio salinus]|uniref:tetraacyldisaccharide 4'-kinase n=1 Tax=Vibrio salinus TaxID=2899784 RepID=UPI001E3AEEC4|nr:tetraacyldisaccharide 4'-kinase [Vibrio salinus]MCE0492852.1 tetraacyldisaccharide 4'-kinase [Vibrio salinus]